MGNPATGLTVLVLGTLLCHIPLDIAALWTPAPEPDAKTTAWESHPHQYCPKHLKTAPLFPDPANIYGLHFSQAKCRKICEEDPDCGVYSYGKWTKGIYMITKPMRCQLYSKCESAYSKHGTIVFFKPNAPTTDGRVSIAALLHVGAEGAVIILEALVLLSDYIGIGTGGPLPYFCSALAVAASAFLVSEAGSASGLLWEIQDIQNNTLFWLLAVVHALNCFGLVFAAYQKSQASPPRGIAPLESPHRVTSADLTMVDLTMERNGAVAEELQCCRRRRPAVEPNDEEDIPSPRLDASPISQEQQDGDEAEMYAWDLTENVDAEADSDAVAPAPAATAAATIADSTPAPEAEATTPTKTATPEAAAAEAVTPAKTAAPAATPVAPEDLATKPEVGDAPDAEAAAKAAEETSAAAAEPAVPAATPVAAEALATKPEVAVAPESGCYTLEQLTDKSTLEKLDAAKLEKYLSPAAFTELFGMSKEDFDKLPKWKKDNSKKKHGLF